MFCCHNCRRLVRSIHVEHKAKTQSDNEEGAPIHDDGLCPVHGYWNVATTYCTTAAISSAVSEVANGGMLPPPLVTRPISSDASSVKNCPIELIFGQLLMPVPSKP